MPRWALGLLVSAMAFWTAFTVVAGWYAWRSTTGSSASAEERVAVLDVASSDGERRIDELDAVEAAAFQEAARGAVSANEGALPTPTQAVGIARPVPREATSGGFDGRVRPVTTDVRRQTSSNGRSSKGVVVLDPGHGRGDPGAVHNLAGGGYDVTEAQSNQLNAELIRDELITLGYDVYLTREGAGRGPGGPLPLQFITSDLYARVKLAAAVEADVYLAIHGNGASVKSISGPETWYCGKHQEGAANERLASLVQGAMMDALSEYGYFPPDRGIKEDAQSHHSGDFCQFVVTRETAVPAALLEFLFLSNDADAAVLVNRRSHELMAKHVAEAIDVFMRERRGE